MSSYRSRTDQRVADEVSSNAKPDFSCKTYGCPNAGTMERGLCYFHWRAEPLAWPEVTARIKATWPEMANWGQQKRELEESRAVKRRAFMKSNPNAPLGSSS